MDENLRTLYQESLAEDRFQILLNWDRTKFALAINGTILAAAVALTSLASVNLGRMLAVGVFVAGAVAAAFGIKATREGKTYHRAANAKKVLYERELRLDAPLPPGGQYADLSLSGLKRSKRQRILGDVDAYVNVALDPGSFTGAAVILLWTLLVLDVAGAALVGYVVLACPGDALPCL